MTSFPPLAHATSCILLVMLLLLCILHVWRVCPMLRKAPSLQRNLQIAYELSLGVLFLNLTICARIFAEGKVMVNSLLPVIFDCRVFLYAGILCFILSIPVLVASKQPRVAEEGLLALACTPLFGYAVPNLYFLPLIVASVYFFIRDLFFAHVSNQSKTSSVEAISLTEAVNELSSGVLGANTSGRILFMNDAMRDILGSLSLPTDLANAFVVLHNLNPNWQSDPESKITLPNKKTFLLQVSGQTIGDEPCVLAIAYDITQEEQLNESLNRANAILQAQNKELQKTVSDITEAAHKDAVLQMRARMHDIIGQRLSILHRCLEDDDLSDATVSRIRPILHNLVSDLSPELTADPATELATIVDAFSLANVQISIAGQLPAANHDALLATRIIREAATNAVKHAQAKEVQVVMEDATVAQPAAGASSTKVVPAQAAVEDVAPTALRLTITNDGTAPTKPITEGSGLTSLRQTIESRGGTLTLQHAAAPSTATAASAAPAAHGAATAPATAAAAAPSTAAFTLIATFPLQSQEKESAQ